MLIHLGLFIALVATSPAKGPGDAPITLKCVATRVKSLLPELSKATGLELEADQKVSNQVLVIDVKNVKSKDLLDRIAKCVGGQWTKEENTLKLERPSELEVQLRKSETEDTEKWLQVQIEAQKKRYLPKSELTDTSVTEAVQKMADLAESLKRNEGEVDWDEYARKDRELRQSLPSPCLELLLNLVSNLGATALANIPPNSRKVYSTAPNRMQAMLTSSASYFQRYLAVRNMVGRALALVPNPSTRHEIAESYSLPEDRDVEQASKILLVIDREPNGTLYMISLLVIGTKGNEIDRAASVLIDESSSSVKAAAQNPLVEWSPLTTSLFKALESGKSLWSNLDPSVKKYITQPEEQDMLSAAPSDMVLAIAKSKAKNLVAVLPDRLELYNEPSRCQSMTVSQAEQALADFYRMRLTVDGEWFTATPQYPVTATSERFDRSQFGKYIRTYAKKQYATFAECVNAAAGITRANEQPASVHLYKIMQLTGWQSVLLPLSSWEGFKMVSSLTIPQQQALMNGQSLSYPTWPPAFRNAIIDSVYGWQGKVGVNKAVPCYESTELLPNGIPNEATLRLECQNDTAIVSIGADGKEQYITIAALAQMVKTNRVPATMYVSYMQTYRLKIKYNAICENTFNVRLVLVDRSRRVTVDSLPQDLKDQLSGVLRARQTP